MSVYVNRSVRMAFSVPSFTFCGRRFSKHVESTNLEIEQRYVKWKLYQNSNHSNLNRLSENMKFGSDCANLTDRLTSIDTVLPQFRILMSANSWFYLYSCPNIVFLLSVVGYDRETIESSIIVLNIQSSIIVLGKLHD